MKILITGKNSFVGRNFILHSKFKHVEEISLFEKKPCEIDFSSYDTVIHLVAIVHQTKRIPKEEYFRVNKDLCLEVAKYAKEGGVGQFIFLSSVKVYGEYNHDSGPWSEYSKCNPNDSYGISKYEAEKALKQLDGPDFTVSIVRTPLVYGEGVRANMLSIIKLISYSHILPFKNLHNRRNFTSSKNLVAFIDRIIEKKISGVFIAMDEDAISTSELVKMIAACMDKKLILFKLPDFIIRIGIKFYPRIFDRLYGSFEMDNSETLKVLDFKPPYKITEGIAKMVIAYKNEK